MKPRTGSLMSADTVRAIYLIAGVSARPDKRAAAIPVMAEGFSVKPAVARRMTRALVGAGILKPARDGTGQFVLTRRPDQITPREVAELFDGPAKKKPLSHLRSSDRSRAIAQTIVAHVEESRRIMLEGFGKTTFADCLMKKGERPRRRRVSKEHLANCPFHAHEDQRRF